MAEGGQTTFTMARALQDFRNFVLSTQQDFWIGITPS